MFLFSFKKPKKYNEHENLVSLKRFFLTFALSNLLFVDVLNVVGVVDVVDVIDFMNVVFLKYSGHE